MSGSHLTHRRMIDLFDGQNITSSNVAFHRRKLAGTFGAMARRQAYTMYTDAILDSLDPDALGPTAISSIESAISQGKTGFLNHYDSLVMYPHQESSFSVSCAPPALFAQLLASSNMVEGPYASDFNGLAFDGSHTGCFMDSNGIRVASSGPINSLATTQPFLVYINP